MGGSILFWGVDMDGNGEGCALWGEYSVGNEEGCGYTNVVEVFIRRKMITPDWDRRPF